jgi:hypothetical protein
VDFAELAELGLPARLVHADGSVVTVGGWPADPHGAAPRVSALPVSALPVSVLPRQTTGGRS